MVLSMTTTPRLLAWNLGALVGPITAAALIVPIEAAIGTPSVALLLVVPVVLVAWSGSRLAVSIAAASAALSFDFLFTEPRGSFAIHGTDDLVLVGVLLGVGMIVAQLSVARIRQERLANRMMSNVGVLRTIAELLAEGEATDNVVRAGEFWLRDLLELRECRLSFRLEPPSPVEISSSGEVHVGSLRWSAEHQGLPGPRVDLPVHQDGRVVARFVLVPTVGVQVMPDRLFTAVALADLVGSALHSAPNSVSAN
jgi:hypothetical protein